jgi:hypothetical protein
MLVSRLRVVKGKARECRYPHWRFSPAPSSRRFHLPCLDSSDPPFGHTGLAISSGQIGRPSNTGPSDCTRIGTSACANQTCESGGCFPQSAPLSQPRLRCRYALDTESPGSPSPLCAVTRSPRSICETSASAIASPSSDRNIRNPCRIPCEWLTETCGAARSAQIASAAAQTKANARTRAKNLVIISSGHTAWAP